MSFAASVNHPNPSVALLLGHPRPFDDVVEWDVLPRSEEGVFFFPFDSFLLLCFWSLAPVAVGRRSRGRACSSPSIPIPVLAKPEFLGNTPSPSRKTRASGDPLVSGEGRGDGRAPSPGDPVISGAKGSCSVLHRAAGCGDFRLLGLCHVSSGNTPKLEFVPLRDRWIHIVPSEMPMHLTPPAEMNRNV
ncbi:uncharacterized protein LY79DRAFT_131718 [Colletotrichum navitas]|uniref:Uncharacterized protein n=1 Tax=Colletotrichum navitas TaxID=681940 RepID=A0AAD8Q2I7_9PEZI|nr:uncharacterized protein LY79DRAFT_131718 [Colletotrichum navitas]KAK1594533.1 hypothetical protein LY79DRAFT_131718 [Colletotrichum navitas]